jgi:hypothetical protein
MGESRVPRSRTHQFAAVCALSSAALLTAAGCAGQTHNTPSALEPVHNAAAAAAPAPAASAVGSHPAAAYVKQAPATSHAASAPSTAAATCANGDLRLSQGYGTQSQPLQAWAIVLTNVSDHTCTLRGYPGLSIADGGTTINATRVLNGFRGDLPPLTSPPLVTLAPGAGAYAVVEWKLGTGSDCYPAGSGSIEATAPDSTDTIILTDKATMGSGAVCSGLEINPVVPGTFGTATGQ